MDTAPLLECRNITKTYGDGERATHALRDISIELSSGEFVAIIGASGSGKSTLLHILGGIEAPTSGTVLVDGTDLSTLDATQSTLFRRRKVGLIYQFFNLIPTVNVAKNILMPLLLDKRTPHEAFFNTIVDALGIADKLEAMPSELSGGQQQRVAIARSVIYRPSLLLADEPTGNLDKNTSREIIDLLKIMNRRFDQTSLIITHDEEVALAADRIITVEDGLVIADTGRQRS